MLQQHTPSPSRRPRSGTVLAALFLCTALLLPLCPLPAAADNPHARTVRRRHTDCHLLLTEKRLLGWDVSRQAAKVSEARKIGTGGDLAGALALLEEAEKELLRLDTWRGSPRVVRIVGDARPAGGPEEAPTATVEAGALRLGFDATGRMTGVVLGGRDLASRVAGGFLARDAATGKTGAFSGRVTTTDDGIELSGKIAAVDVGLEARFQRREGRLEVEGVLKETSGADRALVLCFKIPFLSQGFSWEDDPEGGRPIPPGAVILQNSAQVTQDRESTRLVSTLPLACISDQRAGLTLATAIEHPTVFRINYDGQDQSINLYYDFGLTTKTTKFPGEARFRFVIYPLEEPAWGMRSALDTYYRIYPGAFADVVENPGLWGTVDAAAVLGQTYREMGFVFLQGENGPPKWGKKLGLMSIRYCRPWYFLIPGSTEPQPDQLDALVADPGRLNIKTSHNLIFGPVSAPEMVSAMELSAIHGRGGKPVGLADRTHGGVNIILNPDPEIEGGRGGGNAARLTLTKAIAPAVDTYKAQGQHRWGLFYDVAGTTLRYENFRQDHMAWADFPLTYDEQEKRPVILGLSSACEYLEHVMDWTTRRGGMVGVNTSPHPYNMVFLAPFCHMAGTEHLPGRREMHNRRALAGQRPIGFRTMESWDMLLKVGLFYGCFPSRTPPDRVRTKLEHLLQAKPLITRLVPLIKKLDAAGWEPVTRARTGHRDLLVERFGAFGDGPVYLTVWNRTPSETEVKLNLDETARRWCGGAPRASELAAGRKVSTATGVVSLRLGADEVAMIRLEKKGE
jgi:hypothetical protein